MATIKKTLKIKASTSTMCPKGKELISLAEALNENGAEAVKVKTLIGPEKIAGKWALYLDSVGRSQLYGLIDEIEELDDTDIGILITEGNYDIHITSTDGKRTFEGELCVLLDEAAAKQSSDSEIMEEVKTVADNLVKKKIVSREEIDARLKYMDDNDVDGFLQLRVLKQYRKYNKPSHTPSCLYKDPYLNNSRKRKMEGIVSEGLRAAISGHAVILEGEKSVGKNVYAENIAWLLNKPMYLITFSRQMSPSSIYGEKTTDNSAAAELASFDADILMKADVVEEKRRFAMNICARQGIGEEEAINYVENSLSEADKKVLKDAARFKMLQAQSASVNIVIDQSELYDWLIDGGVLIFNEMNMAEANFFASFTNQLLDGTGFLFIPGRGEVKIHPDCTLFGTQNSEYQGVETQNEATMSRFGCIVFPQPESIKEQLVVATNAQIKKSETPNASLDTKYYTECQNFYKQCRGAVAKGMVSNACLNIRGFVRALSEVALSNGYARLKRQVEIHVINTCPVDDRPALIATLENIVTL